MLGLPLWTPRSRSALLDCARVLIEGQVREVDLGKAGERYFLLWTGIGFDAQVAEGIEPYREVRRNLGNLTYYVTAFALSVGMRGTRMTVVIDGRAIRQRVLLVLVTNIQLYGSSWRVAPQAQLNDGLLDVYIFKGGSMLDVVRHAVRIVSGRHLRDSKVETYPARRVEIRGERSLPLHMDGDPVGHTPVTITVVPKALRVIVPSWASGSLFGEGGAATETELPPARRIAQRLQYERERTRESGERL
jgi:YegS/Rv2252/BmrU family lipid kinase